MESQHFISDAPLTLDDIDAIIRQAKQLKLSDTAKESIAHCHQYLQTKIQKSDQLYYGINTGFGSLCNVRISKQQITTLQHNLVRSHACGMGKAVPENIARLVLFLKIQSLSYGYSGVSLGVVQRLVDFYNHDALPFLYEQGSLGASGDLAPLAHLALNLIGEGEMHYQGKKIPAAELHQKMAWQPLSLQAKEGLALLNGTQFSLAYALYNTLNANKIYQWANLIAAMSLDAFDARPEPFDERIHHNRRQVGQIEVARHIRELLEGSEITQQEKNEVQDPYAFRCIPQVHGASKDALDYVASVVERELNAVTDNPNIFPKTDAILSGGNFHAQPLALASDFLAIAMSELGSISERRVYQLISGKRNLPPFLTQGAGLHSGFMIAQYTAASIASQNKQLCTPASVDSIVSCNGQEDHVSMAANAGVKGLQITENLYALLAIELMVAAQALEYRRPLRSSRKVEQLLQQYRQQVHHLQEDRALYTDMQKGLSFLKNGLGHAPS